MPISKSAMSARQGRIIEDWRADYNTSRPYSRASAKTSNTVPDEHVAQPLCQKRLIMADVDEQAIVLPAVFPRTLAVTCLPVLGPIFAGKFQFSGMCDSGRWTRKDHEEIEVYGGA